MKNALLAMSTENEVNIGDYIQQLAAKQFLGEAETFVEREEIDAYDGEEVRMILNGWFMHHPEHWPPSEKIAPLARMKLSMSTSVISTSFVPSASASKAST